MKIFIIHVTHHRLHSGWTDLWISRGFTQKEAEEKVVKVLIENGYVRSTYTLGSYEPIFPSVLAEEI